ncbi:MAG: acylase [Bacteroidota bacterium]
MKFKETCVFYPPILFFFVFVSCQSTQKFETEILWDTWGVPHIYAQSEAELFFAQGWANMHSHGDLICKLYGRSRGKSAAYWGGGENLERDILIHRLGFPNLAKKRLALQDPAQEIILSSFIKGMNAYVEAHPEAISSENQVVLPLTVEDVMSHTLFIFYTRFVGSEDLGRTQYWREKGSNTYAIAPSRTASGKGMLVQNPHLPWFDEFLFYESHGNLPGVNVYGANLVGLPGFGIAFNEHLGWSHTDNTIDNADTYELTLQGSGYLLDGEVKPFDSTYVNLEIKNESGAIENREILLQESAFGPILRMGEKKAIAIRYPTQDRPNAGLQWWKMANSHNLEEFENALQMGQIPFWNVMYADKYGDIFHLFNGHVPKRSQGDWDYWNRIIPSSSSKDIWTEIHSYEELPKVKNPESGWLQNANDPPWTNTFPRVLNPSDFPPYMAPIYFPLRPQRAVRMMVEDSSITFEELVEYKLSTRMELADRILDDLFDAIDTYGDKQSQEAKKILAAWDREADADSKGALLFYLWAQALNPYNPSMYAEPWKLEKARTTPDGLKDPKGAVEILVNVCKEMEAQFGKLDVAWGEAYRLKYGDIDLPGNGADGSVGVFRVAWTYGMEEGKLNVMGGDSWVGVIEFGEEVRAKVLLSYGNSTQPGSPHKGDQLELFSKKEMRDAWFYRKDVEEHVAYREVIREGTMERISP